MAIISGIWMWGNSAVSNGNFSIDVNFTSYPNDFHYTKLSSFYSIPYRVITYGTSETSVWITGNNDVVKDEYKYMDFGDGGQEISDTAYNYINTYATKISNSTKTLISLENLQYFKTKLDNIYYSKNSSDGIVDLTTNQIINGQKTFTQIPKVSLTDIILPEEYQQIEYIRSVGSTQYINTGIPSNAVYGYEIVFTPIQRSSDYSGIIGGTYDNFNLSFTTNNTGVFSRIRGEVNNYFVDNIKKYTFKYVGSQLQTYIDGVLTTDVNKGNGTLGTTNANIYVFRCSAGRNTYGSDVILYSLKFYDENENVIRHYIPCYTKQALTNNNVEYEANTAGLYDVVNNVFYANNGTGSFSVGEKITPVNNVNILLSTDVEANPTDEATDTLSKIKIGEIIYGISGENNNGTVTSGIGEYGYTKLSEIYSETTATAGTIDIPISTIIGDSYVSGRTYILYGQIYSYSSNSTQVDLYSDLFGQNTGSSTLSTSSNSQIASTIFSIPAKEKISIQNRNALSERGIYIFGYSIMSEKNTLITRTTELPEATEISPDFIEVSGELYYKSYSQPATTYSSSITDLTNTTWVFNDEIIEAPLSKCSIDFISNNENFDAIRSDIPYSRIGRGLIYGDNTEAYAQNEVTNGWYIPSYKTITITGGADVQNSTLISFFQENATLQSQSSTYSYVKLSSNN